MAKRETKLINEFSNQYSISKTLRFELKPIGDSERNIKADNILEQDNQKAESYKEVKKIIDNFHRHFIDKSLKDLELDWQPLKEKIETIKNITISASDPKKEEKRKEKDNLTKELKDLNTYYRKAIVKHIKDNVEHSIKDITSAKLIKDILPKFLEQGGLEGEALEDVKKHLKEFKGFDGYFTGFHENRKNIYSDKEQSTAVSYRIVHDNFPKFLDNLNAFNNNIFDGNFNINNNLEKFPRFNNKTKTDVEQEIQKIFDQGTDYFNQTVAQIDIEKYNDYIKVYNLINNLYKQKSDLKNKQQPNLKTLFKQILAESDKGEYIKKLSNDGEVIEQIDSYQNSISKNQTIIHIKELMENINQYELDKIYLVYDQIEKISKAMFDSWHFINDALEYQYTKHYPPKNTKTYDRKKEKWLKQNFNIQVLQTIIDEYNIYQNSDKTEEQPPNLITDYFIKESKAINIDNKKYQEISHRYKNSQEQQLIKNNKNIEEDISTIKNLLDSYQQLVWLIRPLIIKTKKNTDNVENNDAETLPKDLSFYNELEKYYEQLMDIIPIFNLVRNYITQKPYSEEKIKLNFESPTLANGWDINKETANNSVILRRDGLYYLAIINKKHKKVFTQMPPSTNDNTYQKLNYKLLSGANKMLPKAFFSEKGKATFQPSPQLLELYANGEHKKGDNFNLNSCHQLINFFKHNIPRYKVNSDDQFGWDIFDFEFSPTESYQDISQFYKEVEQFGYKIWFSNVDVSYIDECVKQGKIYLLQLYNKDFSHFSKGAKNLHTLYWQELFRECNIDNTIYKLNGEAELFYREKSITEPFIHKVGTLLKHKTHKDIWEEIGLPIAEHQHTQNDISNINGIRIRNDHIYYSNKSKPIGRIITQANQEITKDKRYSENKYFFHVPITINFKARETFNFNQKMQNFLRNNPGINLIGIDRGEKHLAYYCVIDQQGKILDQRSLNTINGVDYHKLLNDVEQQINNAKKNWKTINKIKDLKAGYISQVVHKITQLIVKYNAIVIMEDLNMGMKRSRQKIEKQVYQNLEKALINKLNYLSFKDVEEDQPSSIRHGLQLAAPFESFQKMGKQTGGIFYVAPSYTSKIDFKTGFTPLKYFKYENLQSAKTLMNAINNITYQQNAFVLDMDYSKIMNVSYKCQWQIYLDNQERYQYFPKDKKTEAVNVYEKVKSFFKKKNIDLDNIKQSIIESDSAEVYKKLFSYINLVSQMRFQNHDNNIVEDYILSPVRYNGRDHFRTKADSETAPQNSDANGAYHIALKGLLMLHEKINKGARDLYITKDEWLNYAVETSKNR